MDERDFAEPIPEIGAEARVGGPTVVRIALPALVEVAGDIDGFGRSHPATELGCGGDVARPGPLLIRLARDRALWRPDGALPTAGWHAGGWATVPTGAGWAGLSVTGAGGEDLLRQGVALDLVDGSPSAAVLWNGHRVVLLRDGAGWQLWCATPEAWAVWAWLTRAAG